MGNTFSSLNLTYSIIQVIYGWYPSEYAPKELTPAKFQFITPAGYNITFDEENGSVRIYFDENREVLMSEDETTLKSGDKQLK